MQWWEVNRYLAGIHRRHRTAWENTRALQWFGGVTAAVAAAGELIWFTLDKFLK